MYSSPSFAISFSACCRTATRVEEGRTSADLRQLRQLLDGLHRARGRSRRRRRSSFCRIGATRPSSWRSSADQQVGRRHLGVAPLGRQRLRGGDGFLGLEGEAVRLHRRPPSVSLGAALELCQAPFQRQDPLDPGQVQAFGGQLLDPPQELDVPLRVEARVLRRALRLDQPARLVHAQRLRVHVGELGGDRDHEDAALLVDGGGDRFAPDAPPAAIICALLRSSARGSAPLSASASFSTASACSSLSSLGTLDLEPVADVAAALAAPGLRRALAAQPLDACRAGCRPGP